MQIVNRRWSNPDIFGILRASRRFYAAWTMILVMLGGAGLILACLGPRQVRVWRQAQELTTLDTRGFADAAFGQPTLLVGTLKGDPAGAPGGLLIYDWQQWTNIYDEQGSFQGTWCTSRLVAAGLALRIDAQAIQITTPEVVEQGGHRHSQTLDNGNGQAIGFRDGDQVTVMGHKDIDGRLALTHIYGGDRDALIRELRQNAYRTYLVGIVLIVLAALVLVLNLISGKSDRRATARTG